MQTRISLRALAPLLVVVPLALAPGCFLDGLFQCGIALGPTEPFPGAQLTATSSATTELSVASGAAADVQWDTVIDAHVTDQSGGVGNTAFFTLGLHNADDASVPLPTDVHVRVTVTVLAPDGTIDGLLSPIDDQRGLSLATCTAASCDVHDTVHVHLERLDDHPVRLRANLSVSDVFDYGIQGCGTPG